MIVPRPYDGKPISEPGVFENVPMSKYHGPDLCDGPSISSSGLRTIFNSSLAHYWVTSPYNPNRVEEDEKEAFILGRAAHHLLLGEDDFRKHFAVRPDQWDSWRTNAAKEWRAEQLLRGVTVLEPRHIEVVQGMAASLEAHPLIRAGILNGLIEQTVVWKHAETGIWLKARPDAIPSDSGDFVDLKTASSVDDDTLESTLGDFGYPVQGAVLALGVKAVLGIEMNTFNLVFVEKKPPHCVRVVSIRPDDIAKGIEQVESSVRAFTKAMKTMDWTGPGGTQRDAVYLSPKPWALKRIDDRLAELQQEEAA